MHHSRAGNPERATESHLYRHRSMKGLCDLAVAVTCGGWRRCSRDDGAASRDGDDGTTTKIPAWEVAAVAVEVTVAIRAVSEKQVAAQR